MTPVNLDVSSSISGQSESDLAQRVGAVRFGNKFSTDGIPPWVIALLIVAVLAGFWMWKKNK